MDNSYVWFDGNMWNRPPESLKVPVDGSKYMTVTEVARHQPSSVQVTDKSGNVNSQRNQVLPNYPDPRQTSVYSQQQYGNQQFDNVQYTNTCNNPYSSRFHQMHWSGSQWQYGSQQYDQRPISNWQNNQAGANNSGQMWSSNAQQPHQRFDGARNREYHHTNVWKNKVLPNHPDPRQVPSHAQQKCDEKFDKEHYEKLLYMKNLDIALLKTKFEVMDNQIETLKKENETMKKQLEVRKADSVRGFYPYSSYIKKANRVTELEIEVEEWERNYAELEHRHVELAKTTFGDPFSSKNKAVQTGDQSTSTKFDDEDAGNKDSDELEQSD
ncbi:hypothetical protein CAEBREN_13111 [Caenorhabditis brenneri]|uniref:Uncharacterized protein n=1 Tax=Caenorhabditis brenneri TaxID=135651 RepID=G0P2I3_CAEBE|nr:hypothetical protein CAEBREN_13111 [Caenorhabditis brenneri]